MTTKTTIISSPLRRAYLSSKWKKHRMFKSLEHQRREMICSIANVLRNVGDQLDEQIQIDHLSSNDFLGQQTERFLRYFSTILRLFL